MPVATFPPPAHTSWGSYRPSLFNLSLPAFPLGSTNKLKAETHICHCSWYPIPQSHHQLCSRKPAMASISCLAPHPIDHKYSNVSSPNSFQYPSLKHQKAFPMKTTDQAMKTDNIQPSYSLKIQRWIRNQGTKYPPIKDKSIIQHLDLESSQSQMLICQCNNTGNNGQGNMSQ